MNPPDDAATIAEAVRDLTQPATHIQPYRAGWKYRNRTGPVIRNHKTNHASLLDQLRDAITQRAVVGKWRPVPPGMSDTKTQPHFDADAFDRLQTIETATAQWLNHFGMQSMSEKIATTITAHLLTTAHAIETAGRTTDATTKAIDTLRDAAAEIRSDVEPNLRALTNLPADATQADIAKLARDTRHWRTWCRIFAGWEIPPARPRVPCPNCDAGQDHGKGLRVRFDDLGTHNAPDTAAVRAAVCLSCNATWDERSIGILAEHIRQAGETDSATDQRDEHP